ncbi:MAG TPA: peptidoglycan-binding protein [Pyrinomonadaceae bacterium]|nr:peptidoglycan-binding protein [Pyrinomonadaceae bacterium]
MPNLINVPGIENTSDEFRQKVIQIASNLQIDPNFLMAIMSFESGASFSPSKKNAAGSGAVGLIQFMPKTAKALGTSTQELAAMTAVRQLDFIEKYFTLFKGRLKTIEDAYMAVLLPTAVGKGPGFVLFTRPGKAYTQNKGLDLNGDGLITVAEAASRVRQRLGAATSVMVPTPGAAPLSVTPAAVAILSKGMESPAVEVLQDELVNLGYLTLAEKKTGPGKFGNKTEAALKVFQSDNLLDSNGTYDAATQAAVQQLDNGVQLGSEGGVVLPMQNLLVAAKLLTQQELDTGQGIFGKKTQRALMQFQLNNNIQPSGVLTNDTYKALYKTEPVISPDIVHGDNGAVDTVLPENGPGFTTFNREPGGVDQFGTQTTIRALQDLALAWAQTHPAVLIQFGDISRRGGGPFFNAQNHNKVDHADHKEGRAVDIRPIAKGGALVPTTFNSANYDGALTKELAQLMKQKFPNSVILFNDPKLIAAGLTKQHAGHDNHLHWLVK